MAPLLLVVTVFLLVLAIAYFKVHPFVALLGFAWLFGIASGMPAEEAVSILLEGFGNTLKWIALIMIFGTFIGEVARETGGARRIADATLKAFGKKRLPVAMGFTGYIVSIPVFVDVAYIMMKSITESLSRKSGRGILVVGLSLVAGLTATHALLPPTPGPLAVAAMLGANLGKVILVSGFVALCAMAGGIAWAVYGCARFKLKDSEEPGIVDTTNDVTDPHSFTPTLVAFFPILIPLLLIAVHSFSADDGSGWIPDQIRFLGIPVVALCIGALLSLIQFGRHFKIHKAGQLIESSIVKSALVIMITAAGGAFGHVIRNSGVVEDLSAYSGSLGSIGFLLPFVVAALFTTATGSITVSMVTSASITAPLLSQLNVSPEMATALIGCGAFCVFHVNASFFWLFQRLHNVPPAILLRTYTLQSLVMGLSGLFAVLILRLLFSVT